MVKEPHLTPPYLLPSFNSLALSALCVFQGFQSACLLLFRLGQMTTFVSLLTFLALLQDCGVTKGGG